MAEVIETQEAEKKVIKLSAKTTVKTTDKHPGVKQGRVKSGQIINVHPNQVEYLKSKGYIKELS